MLTLPAVKSVGYYSEIKFYHNFTNEVTALDTEPDMTPDTAPDTTQSDTTPDTLHQSDTTPDNICECHLKSKTIRMWHLLNYSLHFKRRDTSKTLHCFNVDR